MPRILMMIILAISPFRAFKPAANVTIFSLGPNCINDNADWAMAEIEATQEKNTRAKSDKTYHVVISFPTGENPPDKILKIIEERIVASIGLSEHQRISAAHHDTDNLHIHLAINKIHPKTFAMNEPYLAYKKFAKIATELESEFNLIKTNHTPAHSRSENLANDMEHLTGIESFLNWIKRQCLEDLKKADSWIDFSMVLAEHNLTLLPRGNGFVITNNEGFTVKASSVSREFSKAKLETRFGKMSISNAPSKNKQFFKTNYEKKPMDKQSSTDALYHQYIEQMESFKDLYANELSNLRKAKDQAIEKAKQKGRIKRSAIKLFQSSRGEKKVLHALTSRKLKKDIDTIMTKYRSNKGKVAQKYQRHSWADWLQHQAKSGNTAALTVLRNKAKYQQNQRAIETQNHSPNKNLSLKPETVTKDGTAIYSIDKCTVRNTGKQVSISKGMSVEGLRQCIELAQQQFGKNLKINGDDIFKNAILRVAVKYQMDITFTDPKMEAERINLLKKSEIINGQSRTRSTTHGSAQTAGANTRSRKYSGGGRKFSGDKYQSDVRRSRQGSPAEGQNSLPSVPQLDVVQLSGRSEVLLPDNAHDKLGRERLKPDNKVRRSFFGLGPKK